MTDKIDKSIEEKMKKHFDDIMLRQLKSKMVMLDEKALKEITLFSFGLIEDRKKVEVYKHE